MAFGTLTAITIQTLRQRQILIRAALNKESCALRNLHSACRAVFSGSAYDRERLQTNVLLGEYCTRLIFESRLGVDLDVLERLGASDSELDGITEVLYGAKALPRDPGDERLFLQNTDFTAMNLLRDLQQKHRLAYLFISHDLRVVRALADRVMVMKDGRVVEQGDAVQIFQAPQTDYTRALFAAAFEMDAATTAEIEPA